MRIKRLSLCTVALLLLVATAGIAQSGKIKRAKQLMKDLSYRPAIALYTQVLEKEDNAEAKISIAECYRKVNDWENAEYWYGQVVRLPQAEPIHKMYYGQALQHNGKCDLAKEWYNQFAEAQKNDIRGQYLSQACDYENELMTKSAALYTVKHATFNTNLDDWSPAIYKDKIVFASDRDGGSAVKREHTWTGAPFNDLYQVDAKKSGEAEMTKVTFGKATKFSRKLNSKYHDAAISFSKDGNTVFYTGNNKTGNDDEDHVLLKIYQAKASGDTWTDVAEVPFNSDEYHTAHPSISADGQKLYFVSDMPGGFGGLDVYVSELQGGKWGPPQNLGPKINTEGHEMFPYIASNGKLFFASDGHIGLGGLDMYSVEMEGTEWGMPYNLGAPMNSKYDDFGAVMDEKNEFGYFTSDRPGGSGRDDIYYFVKQAAPVEILVYDKATKMPIQNAVVVDSCTNITYKTNKEGKVKYEMKLNECCKINASFDKYIPNKKDACSKDIASGDKVIVEIPLSKIYKAFVEGTIFDASTSMPLEGASVVIMNDCGKPTPDSVITSSSGKFKFQLENDCCYKIRAGKSEYLAASQENLCTKNLSSDTTFKADINLMPIHVTAPSEPGTVAVVTPGAVPQGSNSTSGKGGNDVVPNRQPNTPAPGIYKDLSDGLYKKDGKPYSGNVGGATYKNGVITQNTGFERGPITGNVGDPVTFLLHIYYDFDQAYIRGESKPELEKLARMLKDNPEYIVEVGSHTDARGSDEYNTRLSQRRAESVKRWLCSHGIEADRLQAKGYGETMMTNNCINNVPCSEKEHQMNRRTEFKVVGKVGGDLKQASSPNENTKVDKCNGCPF